MAALGAEWRKSSLSNTNGSCVEVRRVGDLIEVRDTKQHGEGPTLSFTEREWTAFTGGVRLDEFEL